MPNVSLHFLPEVLKSSTVKLGHKELLGRPKIVPLMPKVPYPYEVNGKLVTGNGSLIPICTLLPSLTVVCIHIMFHSKHLQCTLFNVALVLSGFVLAKSFISSLQQGRSAWRTQLPMALINVFNFLSLQRV